MTALEHLDAAGISPGICSIVSGMLPKTCTASLTLNAQPVVCSCHCCFLKGDGLPLQAAVRSCQCSVGEMQTAEFAKGIMPKQPHCWQRIHDATTNSI